LAISPRMTDRAGLTDRCIPTDEPEAPTRSAAERARPRDPTPAAMPNAYVVEYECREALVAIERRAESREKSANANEA